MYDSKNKSKIEKVQYFIEDPDYRFLVLASKGYFDSLSDEDFLKRKFRALMGYELNLENPQTFNEKLQWLKLHDRNPEYIRMVDKYEVKQYVAGIIGEEYIIPTLGVWNSFEEIDFNKLPNQFVLKCTHDSGGIVICKDKKAFNIRSAKDKINKSLKRSYFYYGREWPYKKVKPRIIAEPYLTDESGIELMDYKFMCFQGVPKIILICKDRFTETGITEDFFDSNWNHLNFKRLEHECSKEEIVKPRELDELLNISVELSRNIPFIRCDYYIVQEKIYFGELTFYPASGFEPFDPPEWDKKLGDWIQLPAV